MDASSLESVPLVRGAVLLRGAFSANELDRAFAAAWRRGERRTPQGAVKHGWYKSASDLQLNYGQEAGTPKAPTRGRVYDRLESYAFGMNEHDGWHRGTRGTARRPFEPGPAPIDPPSESTGSRHGGHEPAHDPSAHGDRMSKGVAGVHQRGGGVVRIGCHPSGGLSVRGESPCSTDRPRRISVPSSKSLPMNVKPPLGVLPSSEVGRTRVG